MDRRDFLRSAPIALGIGALGWSGPAYAVDPSYWLKEIDNEIVLRPTTAVGWTAATLQQAVSLAQTNKKPLHLLPGNYQTSSFVISAPVEIYGSPGQVIIQPVAGATTCYNIDIRPTNTTPLSGVAIRGISFWGNNLGFTTGAPGSRIVDPFMSTVMPNFNAIVTAYLTNNLVIEKCAIGGTTGGAIALWQCQNAQIQGNELLLAGCALLSNNGWQNLIADNYVHDNARYGIIVTQWQASGTPASFPADYTIIRGNRVANTQAGTYNGKIAGSGQAGNAIACNYAHQVEIVGNVCVGQKFSGIRCNSSFSPLIANNQVIQSGETAIYIECPGGALSETSTYRYEGGAISGNIITTAGRGIAVTNGDRGGRRVSVTGNNVKGMTRTLLQTSDGDYFTEGRGIDLEGDTVASGNIIEDCAVAGILALIGPPNGSTRQVTCACTGNNIRNAPFGIAFFKDAPQGYTLIESNTVQGAGTTAQGRGAIVPVVQSCTSVFNCSLALASGAVDWGRQSGGFYSGKPYPNVAIGQNFVV